MELVKARQAAEREAIAQKVDGLNTGAANGADGNAGGQGKPDNDNQFILPHNGNNITPQQ